MVDLTRPEKIILIFLIFTFIMGLGVNFYKKTRNDIRLSVQPGRADILQEKHEELVSEQKARININSLDIDELIALPGVGKQLADRIVRYHQEYGPFTNKEDLMRVKGMGEKKFEAIKDLIVVEDGLAPSRN
ncbi:MAG: helix-hairpin-helix domain-containing protein [Candidatus Omnitrophota bacterium]